MATNVGFPKKSLKNFQQNLNTLQELLQDLQNDKDVDPRNNEMLTISIRMANEVLLSTIECVKIYQQNTNASTSNDTAEIEKLSMKIKENEEIIQQQKNILDQQTCIITEMQTTLIQLQEGLESAKNEVDRKIKNDSINSAQESEIVEKEVGKEVLPNESKNTPNANEKRSKNEDCTIVEQNYEENAAVQEHSHDEKSNQKNLKQLYKPRTFYNKEESIKTLQAKASKELAKEAAADIDVAVKASDNKDILPPSKKTKSKKSKKENPSKNGETVDEKNITENNATMEASKNETVEALAEQRESTTETEVDQHKLNLTEIMQETDLAVLIQISKDSSSELQYAAITQILELLVTGKAKVDECVESAIFSVFLECLDSTNFKTQLAAVRLLSVMLRASSAGKKLAVDLNVIPKFISLMGSSNSEVKKYALRCISNIMAEKWEFRDKCIELGFLPPFFEIAKNDEDLAVEVPLVIFRMCSFKSEPISGDIIHQFLPILDKYFESNDSDVLDITFHVVNVLCWLDENNIQLIVEHKFLNKMVAFLDNSNLKIVENALIAFKDITARTTEEIKAVVDTGIIQILIKFLDSSDLEIKDQVLRILGNIAQDKGIYRDQCIEFGLIPKVIEQISKENTPEQLRHNFDMVISLCQSNAYPISTDIISQLMPLLKKFLHHEDEKIIQKITLILWTIVIKKDTQKNQLLIKHNIFQDIIPLLHHSNDLIQHYTSRTILNIVFGTLEQIQHVIDCGVMNYMEALLTHKNEEIQSNMLFFLRKIIWLQHKHIQVVINANLIPSIIPLLNHESVLVQKDAVWFISNFAVVARPGEPMNYLLNHEFIPSFCGFLDSPEIFNVKLVLKGISAIVRKCSEHLKLEIRQKFNDCGAVEKLKEFESNNIDHEILSLVREILWNNFFASRGTSRSNINQRNINHFMPHYFKK